MAMLKHLSSRFDNESNKDDTTTYRWVGTWQQWFDTLKIDPVTIPWNANGALVLEILRDKYGAYHCALSDTLLDETVRKFEKRSRDAQIAALGAAAEKIGLTLCYIDRGSRDLDFIYSDSDCIYIDTTERIDEINNQVRSGKTTMQNRIILEMIKPLGHHTSIDEPEEDIHIPVSSIQIGRPHCRAYKLEHFLVVPYKTYETNSPVEHDQLRIYDLRYWPMRELRYELTFCRDNIMPYTLIIESECGEKFCFVGENVDSERSLVKAEQSENGGCLPVDSAYIQRYRYIERPMIVMPKSGGNSFEKMSELPKINDATPFMLIDNCVIYCYQNEDVDHRDPDESAMTLTMRFLKDCKRRRKRTMLLEYNTQTKKFRKIDLPGIPYVSDMVTYKNTWIVLPYNHQSCCATSYLLRLWNPRTNECLRLTSQDTANHEIEDVFSTPNGDILLLLDDGRLCHLDVDLVSWLKEDMHTHDVPLDPWQDEVRRSYENFPELGERYRRLRWCDVDDRMLITFEDGKKYDVMIRENK